MFHFGVLLTASHFTIFYPLLFILRHFSYPIPSAVALNIVKVLYKLTKGRIMRQTGIPTETGHFLFVLFGLHASQQELEH